MKILSHLPCPNPNPEILAVEISGGPAELELRIYTPALALVEVLRLPGLQQGRVTLKLPGADKLSASGLYFYRLEARALGGAEKHAVTGRFLMLW